MTLVAGLVLLAGRLFPTYSLTLGLAFKAFLVILYLAGLVAVKFFLPIEMQTIKAIIYRPFESSGQTKFRK